MPKPKTKLAGAGKARKKNKKDEEIEIKKSASSLGDFVRRELPSDEEVSKFDEFAEEEVREEDIEESLSDIYRSDGGGSVNVRQLDIKKKKGFFFWFFIILFLAAIFGGLGYGGYYLYYEKGSSKGDIEFSITANERVMPGEEFFYTVDLKNLSNIAINDIEIRIIFPDNFIFLDSAPAVSGNNDFWKINSLDAHRSEQLKIKGKIIGIEDTINIVTGSMTYSPSNFSSEFKKESAFKNVVSESGIEFIFDAPSGVLVDEESEIIVSYKKLEDNYLNNFRLSVEPLENMEFIEEEDDEDEVDGVWQIEEIKEEEEEINIKFKINEKINPNEELVLIFENSDDGENYYKFYEEKIEFEVIKSDLNLNLIINGSRNDQGVDAGQKLSYSIVYANKGETEMEDVIIMAVLDSDVLDWDSLEDENGGQLGDGTVSWSKEEISELENLEADAEGIIDFMINIKPLDEIEIEPGKKYKVESYAQFSIGNIETKENEDTRSNTIVNNLNSDLSLDEQVRYFSDDNIAVGSGPVPPKVGETTSYKVYWTLTNNLHELNNLKVEVDLPEYVSWDNKDRSTAGSLDYNEGDGKIVWNIGRLPISVYKAEAEFNISVTPTEDDIDKIMVLLPGYSVAAFDKETDSSIKKEGKAKTTRLEDDDTAETDGRVVK